MQPLLEDHAPLYTDFYELTMAQGFFLAGKHTTQASFDYFYREMPFGGGYCIFAGLQDVLETVENYSFDTEAIDFLARQGFRKEFLDYLKTFRFKGSIVSIPEGELFFPYEPAARVEGTIIETQLIETLLLNMLNFQSLIATKASRIRIAAGDRRLVDFGLRRAQGMGGVHASRAAMIGGVNATSNVLSGYYYDLPLSGTHAHSWIQSFSDEVAAFRKFAEFYPDRCFLLVDTYNTLQSGVPNAITVAKELEQKGQRLIAIRLDSGDLAYLSKKARAMLDAAELQYVKIVASNQLDEYVIRSLIDQGAPIDIFGVGTTLITGKGAAALDGVYKLTTYDGMPQLKISDNFQKVTLPGKKKILRCSNGDGMFAADGILCEDEQAAGTIHHPFYPEQHSDVSQLGQHRLERVVMENGQPAFSVRPVSEIAKYAEERLSRLQPEHKRFENPHVYKVGVSPSLLHLRSRLYKDAQKERLE